MRDLCDNKIYLISSSIIYLFLLNVCFFVTSAPMIIYFFSKSDSIVILIFVGIFVGPSIATLFSAMRRFMNGENTNPFKDYLYFYKLNLIQGLAAGVIFSIFLSICYIDIVHFMRQQNLIIMFIFILLALIVSIIAIYVYLIISLINAKLFDIFKIAIKLSIKKIIYAITMVSLFIMFVTMFYFIKLTLLAFLFTPALMCYVILKLDKNEINQIKIYLANKYIAS